MFRKSLIIVIAIFPFLSFSQAVEETSPGEGTIEEQFRYLIDESNNYQEYKVVKKFWLDKLESNVKDTLKDFHTELDEKKRTIASQSKEIESLKAELAQVNDKLATTMDQKDSMKLFGVSMEKTTYKVSMWSVAGLLFLGLLIFIFRYKNSNTISSQAKETLADVEEEFAQYKKRALEREQKLRRELQDEINKQRGM